MKRKVVQVCLLEICPTAVQKRRYSRLCRASNLVCVTAAVFNRLALCQTRWHLRGCGQLANGDTGGSPSLAIITAEFINDQILTDFIIKLSSNASF